MLFVCLSVKFVQLATVSTVWCAPQCISFYVIGDCLLKKDLKENVKEKSRLQVELNALRHAPATFDKHSMWLKRFCFFSFI